MEAAEHTRRPDVRAGGKLERDGATNAGVITATATAGDQRVGRRWTAGTTNGKIVVTAAGKPTLEHISIVPQNLPLDERLGITGIVDGGAASACNSVEAIRRCFSVGHDNATHVSRRYPSVVSPKTGQRARDLQN